MIAIIGLEAKTHRYAMTLSGGQKRKLSVGIALIAGSKVCISCNQPIICLLIYMSAYPCQVLITIQINC
jgi:ABC-type uncharacterized transport system ATPase subunit